MSWPVVEAVDRCLLHDLARVHDHDSVREAGDDPKIVGNPHHGEFEFALEITDEVEKLVLCADVKGGRGLVRDQQSRPARERDRQHHTLTHPSAELMRIVIDDPFRGGNVDAPQHVE